MKVKKFKDLSDDIVALSKLDDGTYEEIKEPITILQVTGLITDEKELSKIEEAFTLDTSLTIRGVERGQIIWLTALLERTSGSSINSQKLGVVKCRVVDYFYGLNKINQVKKIK